MNWKWPATEDRRMVPWYKILMRVTLLPVIYFGKIVTFLCIWLGWGRRSALDFWNSF